MAKRLFHIGVLLLLLVVAGCAPAISSMQEASTPTPATAPTSLSEGVAQDNKVPRIGSPKFVPSPIREENGKLVLKRGVLYRFRGDVIYRDANVVEVVGRLVFWGGHSGRVNVREFKRYIKREPCCESIYTPWLFDSVIDLEDFEIHQSNLFIEMYAVDAERRKSNTLRVEVKFEI